MNDTTSYDREVGKLLGYMDVCRTDEYVAPTMITGIVCNTVSGRWSAFDDLFR